LTLVIDASSLLILLKRHGREAVPLIEGSYTPTLAVYEIGNALRTETQLLKILSKPRAREMLTRLHDLLPHIHATPPEDADEATTILEASWRNDITYYDAAYLTQAKRLNAILVTEDKKLTQRAEKAGIKTIDADGISP
jgi:predicted nucleic acid-binding protein